MRLFGEKAIRGTNKNVSPFPDRPIWYTCMFVPLMCYCSYHSEIIPYQMSILVVLSYHSIVSMYKVSTINLQASSNILRWEFFHKNPTSKNLKYTQPSDWRIRQHKYLATH